MKNNHRPGALPPANPSRRTFVAAAALIAAAPTLAQTTPTPSSPPPRPSPVPARERIVVAGWSKPITEVMPLLVDEDKGFYRAQGIELQYVPGAGGGDAIRNILSGQADVAFTDPGSLFAALDKGEKLKAIYDIYPQNVFNVVALKSSGIAKPSDLRGKRIGVYSLASGTRQNLLMLLHYAGIAENEVEIVVTGLLNFAPLLQKQVDATAATDTGLLIGRTRGIGDVNVIAVGQVLNVSSDLFVVREETLRTRAPALRRFVRAYRDAAAWMIANPDEATKLAATRAIDGADATLARGIIGLRNASSVSPLTQKSGLGAMDPVSLQRAADVYRSLGMIGKPLSMTGVVDASLLR